jgi:thioredoxin reductase (NADPH)
MIDFKELSIIGGGIAGVSAAVYAKRAGLDFYLFEATSVGGQLLFIEDIENYVGVEAIGGADFAKRLIKTLEDLEVEIKNEKIIKVEQEGEIIHIYSQDKSYTFRGLIIASGASFKKLGVEGEEEFIGRGVSYCAICDGFFFKNKSVVVVGGGNTACEEAIYLSQLAQRVFLIHRRDKLRALDYLQKEIFSKKNVEVVFNSIVKEIKGKEVVEEVVIENTQSKNITNLKINGVFVAVGVKPNTEIFQNIVSLDEKGFIITDESMKTSKEFIWACGDCRKRPLRQLITAASEGAIAALSAYKYLKGYYISS